MASKDWWESRKSRRRRGPKKLGGKEEEEAGAPAPLDLSASSSFSPPSGRWRVALVFPAVICDSNSEWYPKKQDSNITVTSALAK